MLRSTDLGTTLVQAALNPGPTGTGVGVSWKAIASTPSDDARDDALVQAPVYLMDGTTLIASDFVDMWNGDISAPIGLTQFGAPRGSISVWTGSLTDGTGWAFLELGDFSAVASGHGATAFSDSGWVMDSQADPSGMFPLYALSEKLTVPGGPGVIPEPISATLGLMGLAALGYTAGRRRVA